MNVVVTMAGEGRRFRDIGITIPKYAIEVKGRSLFAWAMLSLSNFYDSHFIFVCRKSPGVRDFVGRQCTALGMDTFSILEIDYLTKGQAATAMLAESLIGDPGDEIMIYNIDTYVEPDQLRPQDIRGDGWVPCFKAEGDRWSFVQFDEDMIVTQITEKVRISEFATIGLYYFKSFSLFASCCRQGSSGNAGEQYIAPLYDAIIRDAELDLRTSVVSEQSVHVLGTPEDIRQFDPAFAIGGGAVNG